MKLISWNIAHRADAWRQLLDTDADVALLQEASEPPPDVAAKIQVDGEPWRTDGSNARRAWRTAVVRLKDRVRTTWYEPRPLDKAGAGEFAVSLRGSLAAALVEEADGTAWNVVSMYGPWESPHKTTSSSWIYADASVHRVISDLSVFVGQQAGHRIIAAGDLNILHGYGEGGSPYWKARYHTIFERMRTMGLPFVGPQAPNGRVAEPRPAELPERSLNVPTFRSNGTPPGEESRQLDFVFASASVAQQIRVRALNKVDEWGPSDHCRVLIEIA